MNRKQDDRKEDRNTESPPPARGSTITAQGENQAPKARMPHERDESADSQAADNPQARRMGAIAHDDLAQGQQDTSKAQETDATYHRMREGADDAPLEPRNRRGREN